MFIRAYKSPIFFLLPLLCLSFASSCLCYEVPDPKTDFHRCIERCRSTEKFLGLIECESRCEQKYEEGGWGNSGGSREGERETSKDPTTPRWEIERCQRRCEREERGREVLQQCKQRCEEEAIKEREREQERGQREGEEQRGREEDPQKEFEKCRDLCEKQEPRQQPQCERMCKRQYEERQREQEEKEHGRGRGSSNTGSREYEEQQRHNPYYFHSQRLKSRFRSQNGHFRVLERFSKKSELLRAIENYRFAIIEANPNTFVILHHCDSDAVLFVLRGKGIMTFASQGNRESYSLERGDVMKVEAGAVGYLINPDDNEKFSAAMLVNPINTPGKFREYFAAGGKNSESVYTVFSNDILETALASTRDQLDRLFGQQKQGMILKAPEEKLKALSQHASSSKHKRSHEGKGPINLLNQRPLYSNKFGKFFEVSPNDYKPLHDVDISIGLADINQGALMVPHYNSRSTYVILVVEGSGRIEMACPHLARQREIIRQRGRKEQRDELEKDEEYETETSGQQYQKISSDVSQGDVFVVPAGHPVAVLASENGTMRTLGFGINAQNNERNFLAGQDNVMNQVEKEAKELCFNAPAELVEKIFKNQKQSHFVGGPQQGQKRRDTLASVLDLPGLF